MEQSEKLKVVEEELVSFYQYCQKAGFTQPEMEMICAPLTSTIQKTELKKNIKVVLFVILLFLSTFLVSNSDTVSAHISAASRLMMIKVLPFWDWTSLFYEACLISNPFYKGYLLQKEDCVSCESIERIDRISDVTFQHLLDGYLSRDAPVIISDATINWPVMNTDQFYFENITQAYLQDEKLMDTVPCVLTSNLRLGSYDLWPFLKKIQNPSIDKWFVHWQNCDINAVKALRRFYQRPYFLSTSVAPAHFNWVLMSSDYNSKIYKNVELDSGLIMVTQLRGSTSFRITAQAPCNASCPELKGDLEEGEILVFTNFIWTFEYHPGKHLDNVAILTETIWDENKI